MQKHIIFFYSGHNPYRIKRFREVCNRLLISHEFIDLETIIIDDNMVNDHRLLKKDHENIGFFIGYSKLSTYVMHALDDRIHFPQKEHWMLADKMHSHFFLLRNNIPTPTTALITSHHSLSETAKKVDGFPCIIKKTTGGNGKLVDIVRNESECIAFIIDSKKNIAENSISPRNFSFILQRPITESYGTDYRALCIGHSLIGIMQRKSTTGSFKANFSLGGDVRYVQNIPEIQTLSENIMKKSGLFMAGIDFVKSNSGFKVIEINTAPQFQGFEKATKIDVAEHIITNLIQ